MKIIKLSLLVVLVALISIACNKTEDEQLKINVTLVPEFEITQSDYVPLSCPQPTLLRNTNSEALIYAVQILEEGQPFYYGLFDDASKMEIALTTGKNYTFKVAAFQNGTGSGLKTFVKGISTYYFLPDSIELLNKFVKGDLLKGIANIYNAKLSSTKLSKFPEIDALYQETTVAVAAGMSTLNIPLKRIGFGLSFTVDGLTTGNISVYFEGDTIQLSPTQKSYFSIRAFTGGSNGIADVAKVDTYFINSNCIAKWTGTTSTVVTSTKTIQLKRNYHLPLVMNLNSTTSGVTIEGWNNESDPLDEGLVAHYTFDGNANDISRNKLHGILNGPTLTSDRFGNENSAYQFDGVDDYIDLSAHAASFNIAKPASISFWVKTRVDIPQTVFSMCNKAASDSVISSIFLGNGVTQLMYDELITVSNVNTRQNYYLTALESYDRFWLLDDNWHNIVVTYSDSLTKIYLDNHLLPLNNYQKNDGDFGILKDVDYVTLGTRWALRNGAFFKGSIDDFRFYNRALTTEEVAELFY